MIMVNRSAKGGTTLRKGWYKRPQPWYISDAIIILRLKTAVTTDTGNRIISKDFLNKKSFFELLCFYYYSI